MRTYLIPALLLGAFDVFFVLGPVGCASNSMPAPDEYVRFSYQIAPATMPTAVDIPFYAGTQHCLRDSKEITIAIEKGKVILDIDLHAAATMPASFTADVHTKGIVDLNVTLPSADMQSVSTFSTGDPVSAFTCLIQFGGPDPFAVFDGTFSCQSRSTGDGSLILTDGQVHATMCPPLM